MSDARKATPPMSKSRSTHPLLRRCVLLAVLLAGITAAPSHASQIPPAAYGFAGVNAYGNGFYNWDAICSAGGYCNSASLVDNPINMIYFHAATVRAIKASLASGGV